MNYARDIFQQRPAETLTLPLRGDGDRQQLRLVRRHLDQRKAGAGRKQTEDACGAQQGVEVALAPGRRESRGVQPRKLGGVGGAGRAKTDHLGECS